MATITLSPLLVDIRGKVQDTVYSIWKGRNYIRSRVTPANPQSADQTKQRAIMTAAVTNWQGLHADLVAAWNTYGTPYRVSGYNAFTARNASTATPNGSGSEARMELAAGIYPSLMRPTPGAKAIVSFAPVTGGSGQIDCTWTATGWLATDYIYVATWLENSNPYYGAPVVTIDKIAANAGTHTITGLAPSGVHTVAAIAIQTVEEGWSAEVGAKTVSAG